MSFKNKVLDAVSVENLRELRRGLKLGIIDLYILKKYLTTFFFITLLFTMVSVVIDASEKIDDFAKVPSWKIIIWEYYVNFIPYINALLMPLFALIAVIFFTSRLASTSEIIAMIGTGINFYRLLVPYFLGAFILFVILWWGNNYVIPNGNKKRVAFENTYVWKNNFTHRTENIHLNIRPGEMAYFRVFNSVDSTGRDFTLTFHDENMNVKRKLLAATIFPSKGKPWGTWTLQNYRWRILNGMQERIIEGKTMDTLLNVRVADLVQRDNFKDAMTSPELRRFIEEQKSRGSNPAKDYEVELYRRSSDPFSIIILTVMGLSFAARKVRGGLGIHIMVGMALSGIYVFVSKFSATFAIQGGLSPVLGVWIPNIVFSVVAAIMLMKAQK